MGKNLGADGDGGLLSLAGSALMAVAASKFIDAAAEKAATVLGEGVSAAVLKKANTQIDAMWQRVKQHFAPNQKAAGLMAQVEAGSQHSAQSAEAFNKLAVYLDDDLAEPQHSALADELRQMTQQIVNIGVVEQQQTAQVIVEAHDQSEVNAVGEISHVNTLHIGKRGS